MTHALRVTCAIPAFNAGETTRGIELAKAIRDVGLMRGRAVIITFVYPRTPHGFETSIDRAGFQSRPVDFSLTDREVAAFLEADHAGEEFVRELATARQFIEVCVAELAANRPDLLVFGFLPPAGIAAQLLRVPSVSYLPFPAYAPWVRRNLLENVPEEFEGALLAHAPQALRRLLPRLALPYMTRKRFFTQPTFAAAARERGWAPACPDLFAMLEADCKLVNDLPSYYAGEDIGPRTHLTGPLFSRPADVRVAPDIAEHLAPRGLPRIFVSLGSSGEKLYLLAAIEAVASLRCRAVVIVPSHVCTLEEAKARSGGAEHVLLTDTFLPAPTVNGMADYAIVHGGQGTVQTAVFSGTPMVGVGMQIEQMRNLDKLAHHGAAVRIARRHWRPDAIAQALRQMIATPSFRTCAEALKAEFDTIDGWKRSGELIWDQVDARGSTEASA